MPKIMPGTTSTNNKFEYDINVEEGIDAEITEIPPMMIQPFVENAIIHGIKKKETEGKITINFKIEKTSIICEITDNGVGRTKSTEKKKNRGNHKSTGISVTKKRLEQLKSNTGQESGIKIVDLIDTDNNATGTKVIITIPFETY